MPTPDTTHDAYAYLGGHLCTHNIQLFASLHLEEVQEIGHCAEQDAATDPDSLG